MFLSSLLFFSFTQKNKRGSNWKKNWILCAIRTATFAHTSKQFKRSTIKCTGHYCQLVKIIVSINSTQNIVQQWEFFFTLFFCNLDDDWAKMFTDLLLYACLNTSANIGLFTLPKLPSVFNLPGYWNRTTGNPAKLVELENQFLDWIYRLFRRNWANEFNWKHFVFVAVLAAHAGTGWLLCMMLLFHWLLRPWNDPHNRHKYATRTLYFCVCFIFMVS